MRDREGMVVFRGVVVSGEGDLSRWMDRYRSEYEEATGVSLFPGSLNVVLDEPWPLPPRTITISADRVGRLVHLVPASIEGHDCFIFRTDNAERAGPDDRRVLEVLAAVRLRDALGVDDGDSVEVKVDDELLRSGS
jgi:CTP-dependent riboflavin kinase